MTKDNRNANLIAQKERLAASVLQVAEDAFVTTVLCGSHRFQQNLLCTLKLSLRGVGRSLEVCTHPLAMVAPGGD